MERFLLWLTKHLPSNVLERPGDGAYMTRFYVLRSKWVGVYIHRFWRSDPDGLHDHPWHSLTRVLHGNYIEFTPGELFLRSPSSGWRFMPAQAFHRVYLAPKLAGRTWTIFIRFRRFRTWGFIPEDTVWREAEGAAEKLHDSA